MSLRFIVVLVLIILLIALLVIVTRSQAPKRSTSNQGQQPDLPADNEVTKRKTLYESSLMMRREAADKTAGANAKAKQVKAKNTKPKTPVTPQKTKVTQARKEGHSSEKRATSELAFPETATQATHKALVSNASENMVTTKQMVAPVAIEQTTASSSDAPLISEADIAEVLGSAPITAHINNDKHDVETNFQTQVDANTNTNTPTKTETETETQANKKTGRPILLATTSTPVTTTSIINIEPTATNVDKLESNVKNDTEDNAKNTDRQAFTFMIDMDSAQLTLDLAQQYLELGEYASAKRLLQEVLSPEITGQQASAEQQSIANDLLQRLY